MSKQKTNKTVLKRIKVTAKGKLLRRHQLGVGTHIAKKSKGALERHKKLTILDKGHAKTLRKVLGI